MHPQLTDPSVYFHYQSLYAKKIEEIKERVARGEKIRAGFFVVSLSMMGTKSIFINLLKDELFDAKLVVIPNYDNLFVEQEYIKAKQMFGDENVLQSFQEDGKAFYTFDDMFDIIFFAYPYDDGVMEIHSIEYFAKQGVLTVYIPYGYIVSNFSKNIFISGHVVSCLWKYYVESKLMYEEYLKRSILKEKNAVCLGYAKMDSYRNLPVIHKTNKKIIISAHHTMYIGPSNKGIKFSNFLRYYDFYLRLAKMYPDIDFIFRPHPVFLERLKFFWPQEMIDEYLAKIEALPNMVLHTDPNYFDLFAISDAMLNDCGSFTAEYLFTGKPMGLLSKGSDIDEENYNEYFGIKCANLHYKLHTEIEIINFIEDVVIKENDFMKEERMKFFENEMKGYWPHSTEKIVEDIKHSLLG